MTTSTDTFETVQHFDQQTTANLALARHLDAELQADIDGPRCYMLQVSNHGADWTIESFPAGPGTAREPGVFASNGTRLVAAAPAVSDFPCCDARLCHTCGGTGSIKQQVYIGMKEPHVYSVCGDCGGTGGHAE